MKKYKYTQYNLGVGTDQVYYSEVETKEELEKDLLKQMGLENGHLEWNEDNGKCYFLFETKWGMIQARYGEIEKIK